MRCILVVNPTFPNPIQQRRFPHDPPAASSDASAKVASPDRREDTFPTIAKLWSAYLAKPISESDVCALMILLKAARLSAGYSSADSLVDIAGYAACAAEYIEDRPEPFWKTQQQSDPLAVSTQAYNVRNGIT